MMARALRRLGAAAAAALPPPRAAPPPAAARALAAAAGFAGLEGLAAPGDWDALAAGAVAECDARVAAIVAAPPGPGAVRALDGVSDALCRVLDAAEFCRNAHAAPEWRAAAEATCVSLGGYVHSLNSHYGLYAALARSLPPDDASTAACIEGAADAAAAAPLPRGFDAETLLVGRMLRRDFERAGVHLPAAAQDRAAELVATAHVAGMAFCANAAGGGAPPPPLVLEGAAARRAVGRLPANLRRVFAPPPGGPPGALAAPGGAHALGALLAHAAEPAVRAAAAAALAAEPAANAPLLDALVTARAELAELMGFPSFAAYQLDGFSLARTPGGVAAFLDELEAGAAPASAAEAAELLALKRRLLLGGGGGGAPPAELAALKPYDRAWLIGAARGAGPAGALAALAAHVTPASAVAGLGALTAALTGAALREAAPAAGEAWAPGVRKLLVEHPDEGLLGTVYLDLGRRPGKAPGAAHFTLRSGRRAACGGRQTPAVALVADFDAAPGARLSHGELATLLHEWGHALASLLSTTELQHLSGTRGALDTIEIASTAFERYAHEPSALALFCDAGAPPPPAALLGAAAAARRHLAALELEQMLELCRVDQLLHGPAPPAGAAAAAAVRAAGARGRFGAALDTSDGAGGPHLRLVHLVGYAASYHAYPFAAALTAALWDPAGGPLGGAPPLGAAAGSLLRGRLLARGGAAEPGALVRGLFAGAPAAAGALRATPCGGRYPATAPLLRELGLAPAA
jgi:intermediate peptidase